jgi:hypothetical protein
MASSRVVGGVLWKCKERRIEEINENEMMGWVGLKLKILCWEME